MTQPPGAYPQPPLPAGYPAPPAGHRPPPGYSPVPDPNTVPYSLDQVFRWSMAKFGSHALGLYVSLLIYVALSLVAGFLIIVGAAFLATSAEDGGTGLGVAGAVILALGVIGVLAVAAYQSSAYTAGVVDIADGQQTTIGSFLRARRLGAVCGVLGLQLLAFALGLLLLCIGGFVAAFFFGFAVLIVVDREVGPVEAMRASAKLVRDNLGQALLLWLVVIAISSVIGFLAAPFFALMNVYAYRRFSGKSVAA